jgi:hypothetical protein
MPVAQNLCKCIHKHSKTLLHTEIIYYCVSEAFSNAHPKEMPTGNKIWGEYLSAKF